MFKCTHLIKDTPQGPNVTRKEKNEEFSLSEFTYNFFHLKEQKEQKTALQKCVL